MPEALALPPTPTEPVLDRLEDETVVLRDDASGCDYQGHEFGAHYLDSVCIEGYLWDADSGEADGDGWRYDHGGDLPCPHCNHAVWLAGAAEEVEDQGFNDQSEGRPREENPHLAKSRFEHAAGVLAAAWHKGWDEGQAEDSSETTGS